MPKSSVTELMIVEGRNISRAPTRTPRIMSSSVPSWLEWNTRISTRAPSSWFTRRAYSRAVRSKSESGNPTCPSRMTIRCCAPDWGTVASIRRAARARVAEHTAMNRDLTMEPPPFSHRIRHRKFCVSIQRPVDGLLPCVFTAPARRAHACPGTLERPRGSLRSCRPGQSGHRPGPDAARESSGSLLS